MDHNDAQQIQSNELQQEIGEGKLLYTGRSVSLEVRVWIPDAPEDEKLEDTAYAIEDDVTIALQEAVMSATVVAISVCDESSDDQIILENGEPRMTEVAQVKEMMRRAERDAQSNGLTFSPDGWMFCKASETWLNKTGTIMLELNRDGLVSIWGRNKEL